MLLNWSLFFPCGLEGGEPFAAAGCSLPQRFCPAVGTFADAQALLASSVQGLLLSSPVARGKISFTEENYLLTLSLQNDNLLSLWVLPAPSEWRDGHLLTIFCVQIL